MNFINYFNCEKSWDYNYKAASISLYGSDTLLRNADQVASNDEIACPTAFWYSKTNAIGGSFGKLVLDSKLANFFILNKTSFFYYSSSFEIH